MRELRSSRRPRPKSLLCSADILSDAPISSPMRDAGHSVDDPLVCCNHPAGIPGLNRASRVSTLVHLDRTSLINYPRQQCVNGHATDRQCRLFLFTYPTRRGERPSDVYEVPGGLGEQQACWEIRLVRTVSYLSPGSMSSRKSLLQKFRLSSVHNHSCKLRPSKGAKRLGIGKTSAEGDPREHTPNRWHDCARGMK